MKIAVIFTGILLLATGLLWLGENPLVALVYLKGGLAAIGGVPKMIL